MIFLCDIGEIFEKAALFKHVIGHKKDPVNNKPMTFADIINLGVSRFDFMIGDPLLLGLSVLNYECYKVRVGI